MIISTKYKNMKIKKKNLKIKKLLKKLTTIFNKKKKLVITILWCQIKKCKNSAHFQLFKNLNKKISISKTICKMARKKNITKITMNKKLVLGLNKKTKCWKTMCTNKELEIGNISVN